MAKVMVEIDTSKKTGVVKVDGKKVDNVASLYYSLDTTYNSFMLEIMSREDMNDMKKITRLVANENGDLVSGNEVGQIDMSHALESQWYR